MDLDFEEASRNIVKVTSRRIYLDEEESSFEKGGILVISLEIKFSACSCWEN